MGEERLLLTELEKDRAYKKWCMGYTLKEIADEYFVSISVIHRAIGGRPRIAFEGEWNNRPTERRNPSVDEVIDHEEKVAQTGEKGGCNMARQTDICVVCGKTFQVYSSRQVCCSEECREIRRNELRRLRYERRKQGLDGKVVLFKQKREYRYGKPETEETVKQIDYGRFDRKLEQLKAEGKDYTEEQKKQTIEMYARVKV
jgi:predicted nucleic acid-binding Zn ribbon protein